MTHILSTIDQFILFLTPEFFHLGKLIICNILTCNAPSKPPEGTSASGFLSDIKTECTPDTVRSIVSFYDKPILVTSPSFAILCMSSLRFIVVRFSCLWFDFGCQSLLIFVFWSFPPVVLFTCLDFDLDCLLCVLINLGRLYNSRAIKN